MFGFSKPSSADQHIKTLEKKNFSYKLAIGEKMSLMSQYNVSPKPEEIIWCSVYMNGEFKSVETKDKLTADIKKNEIRIGALNKIKDDLPIKLNEYKLLMKVPALSNDPDIRGYSNIIIEQKKTSKTFVSQVSSSVNNSLKLFKPKIDTNVISEEEFLNAAQLGCPHVSDGDIEHVLSL